VSSNTIGPITGRDWDRALGLDRPEVRKIIEEASARLLLFLGSACAASDLRCSGVDKQPGEGYSYLARWSSYEDRKVGCV